MDKLFRKTKTKFKKLKQFKINPVILLIVINILVACSKDELGNLTVDDLYKIPNINNTVTFSDIDTSENNIFEEPKTDIPSNISSLPEYNGTSYCIINDNNPSFDDMELTTEPFEIYSDLDSLGRCGPAFANICTDIMPTEPRGEIGMIKPSGWHNHNYHGLIDGNYIYNRCHLIGYQLAGENANEKNLITGTRYMNVKGMEPFENQIANYVHLTNHHVFYRVTPVFEGNNLVASGVLMEAESVEDNDLIFCVYCYNVQPGITIDYSTGENWLTTDTK